MGEVMEDTEIIIDHFHHHHVDEAESDGLYTFTFQNDFFRIEIILVRRGSKCA